MNIINIITPCSRPENLFKISKSINIPKDKYRWIVVFDSSSPPSSNLIPDNCEYYCYQENGSRVGNAQRNYALNLIKTGHIYFNDDDTIIHPELWENIKDLTNDFITFSQNEIDGTLRLKGNTVAQNEIDSHNFIISYNILKDSKFIITEYGADGYFARECSSRTEDWFFIDKVLSVYNYLKKGN